MPENEGKRSQKRLSKKLSDLMAEPTYLKVGMIPRTAIFKPSVPRIKGQEYQLEWGEAIHTELTRHHRFRPGGTS